MHKTLSGVYQSVEFHPAAFHNDTNHLFFFLLKLVFGSILFICQALVKYFNDYLSLSWMSFQKGFSLQPCMSVSA